MSFNWLNFVAVTLLLHTQYLEATDYRGCLGSDNDCCNTARYELYSSDSLVLESGIRIQKNQWCDQVVLVRRNERTADDCSGCTLTVSFHLGSTITQTAGYTSSINLYQSNYTSDSFYYSQTLFLDTLATFNASKYLPDKITTNGNLLKVTFKTSSLSGIGDDWCQNCDPFNIVMTITPNIPDNSDNLGVFLGITIPVILLLTLTVSVVVYRVKQRRIARLRARVNDTLSTMVIAAIIQRSRQREQGLGDHPHSPDPTDSVAPPSYTEVEPPPSYTEVMAEGNSRDDNDDPAMLNLEDSAAPETGSDTTQLVV